MDLELAGRVALVTGGATGIGLATVRALAADGATVYLAARDVARGRRVAAEASARGLDVRAIAMDVADARSVVDAFAELDGAGRLDIVVNNAGIDWSAGSRTSRRRTGTRAWTPTSRARSSSRGRRSHGCGRPAAA